MMLCRQVQLSTYFAVSNCPSRIAFHVRTTTIYAGIIIVVTVVRLPLHCRAAAFADGLDVELAGVGCRRSRKEAGDTLGAT